MKLVYITVVFLLCLFASVKAQTPTPQFNATELVASSKLTHTIGANDAKYYLHRNTVAKNKWGVRFKVANNKRLGGVYSMKDKYPTESCPRAADQYHDSKIACGYMTKDVNGMQDMTFTIGYSGPYTYGVNSVYSPTGDYYILVKGDSKEAVTYEVFMSGIGVIKIPLLLMLLCVCISLFVV